MQPKTGFEKFLNARINHDEDNPLSVLSVLSRIDLDPWVQAARLSRLPRATATHELSYMLNERSTEDPVTQSVENNAARLVTLLLHPVSVPRSLRDLMIKSFSDNSLWFLIGSVMLTIYIAVRMSYSSYVVP